MALENGKGDILLLKTARSKTISASRLLITLNLLQAMRKMNRAITILNERCVRGITANEKRCRELVMNSIAPVTALNPDTGYENATRIARIAP